MQGAYILIFGSLLILHLLLLHQCYCNAVSATGMLHKFTHISCHHDEFLCKKDRKCIPKELQCDKVRDCSDGEDEMDKHCKSISCSIYEFQCSSGSCISKKRRCDGRNDCSRAKGSNDNSDEEKCSEIRSNNLCSLGQFLCPNSTKCIELSQKCNGVNDCGNNEDEKNCPCKEASCFDNTCIRENQICDEIADCKNNEDEAHCESNCLSGNLSIKGHCIPVTYVCDNRVDEKDKMDELCSTTHPICKSADRWQCKNGEECVKALMRCDGIKHCSDNSDELNCDSPESTTVAPAVAEFKCSANMHKCANENTCVNLTDACLKGNRYHCRKPDYELLRKCAEYMCNNKGCMHECNSSRRGYDGHYIAECTCRAGYIVDKNNELNCIDIDECKQFGVCSQTCHNTIGSFSCSCSSGYWLNGTSCVAKKRPVLLISTSSSIKSLQEEGGKLVSRDVTQMPSNTYPVYLTGDTELDYLFFYTERNSVMGLFNESRSLKSLLNKTKVAGLAFDWWRQLLFYTASFSYRQGYLMAMNVTNARSVTLMELDCPRALTALPSQGILFVIISCGLRPGIYSIRLGSWPLQLKIVTETTHYDLTPKHLTVDTQQTPNRLYWTADEPEIFSCRLDGTDKRLHGTFFSQRGISSLAVFEDSLMWVNSKSASLMSINKFTGKELKQITTVPSLQSVMVMHPLLQQKHNVKPPVCNCGHVCMVTSSDEGSQQVCLCEYPYKLQNSTGNCLRNTIKYTIDVKPPHKQANARKGIMRGHEGSIASIVIAVLSACLLLGVLLSAVYARHRRNQMQQQQSAMHFANDNYERLASSKPLN